MHLHRNTTAIVFHVDPTAFRVNTDFDEGLLRLVADFVVRRIYQNFIEDFVECGDKFDVFKGHGFLFGIVEPPLVVNLVCASDVHLWALDNVLSLVHLAVRVFDRTPQKVCHVKLECTPRAKHGLYLKKRSEESVLWVLFMVYKKN